MFLENPLVTGHFDLCVNDESSFSRQPLLFSSGKWVMWVLTEPGCPHLQTGWQHNLRNSVCVPVWVPKWLTRRSQHSTCHAAQDLLPALATVLTVFVVILTVVRPRKVAEPTSVRFCILRPLQMCQRSILLGIRHPPRLSGSWERCTLGA